MLHSYRHVVVLTGAGISQSAGLPTYRGPGGLWSDERLAELSEAGALATRRDEVCSMFWSFAQSIARAEPTAAHRRLAELEATLPPSTSFTIITQNVDGLHQRAGSKNVVEYHGSLSRWRCESCGRQTEAASSEVLPRHCDRPMRPAVVLFGEMIPVDAERGAKHALRECDLFVAIGTSGNVAPASSFVRWAALNQARRVLLNLEIFEDAHELFTECHEGTADELVAKLF